MSTTLDQNIHLLLPKRDLEHLRRRAKAEATSVAALIRTAIQRVYGAAEADQKKVAFEKITHHHDLRMEDWPQVKRELLKRYE